MAEPSCRLLSKANPARQFKTEQILICLYIFRCDDLPQRSGSLPSSPGETGLARVHLGLSVPPGESVFSVCFFCYSSGTGSAFQGWKCQRNKEAPLKRSLPPQKGNISAYPLNNNIQRDSLASDPKKEKRLRTLGNIDTHTPLLGRQLGWGCVIPNTELKERKHQLGRILWMANEASKQTKAGFQQKPDFFFFKYCSTLGA